MKTNIIITNILLLVICVITIYILLNIFKINISEGFSSPLKIGPNNAGTTASELDQNSNNNLKEVYNNTVETNNTLANMSKITTETNGEVQKIYDNTNNLKDVNYAIFDNTNNLSNKILDISNNIFSDHDASYNFYDESGNMITQILKKINYLTNKFETKNDIKCLANFGTEIGEKLSNGHGVLKNSQYICPKELPECYGMICGEQYGICK